jgi:hypothetical protein
MKLCYIDAFSGIAGDMTIGALLDAGADFAALQEALTSLNTGATFRFEKVKRRGIAAGKFYVDCTDTKAHRHLHHIEKMITDSPLSDAVKQNSLAVFRKLAQSESRMHATTIEKVHFHEVGAVDSISDIVGACFCLNNLGIEAIHCSAINVGSGTVRTRTRDTAGARSGDRGSAEGQARLLARARSGDDDADRRRSACDSVRRFRPDAGDDDRSCGVRRWRQGFPGTRECRPGTDWRYDRGFGSNDGGRD